jgi:uroporphyrinogen III methyltransferase / synthase
MAFNTPPKVYLVGAGPGDPGLITVRGASLLERADVVVYDHLANPKLLSYCPRAESVYVGKLAAAHSMTQDQINALLVEKARAGKRVVRLKGGDPFIFGRGGEECEALVAAGITFEVVPGITAAVAAPAYAGIPVTHREFNSSFTLITGHEREEPYREPEARSREAGQGSSDIDWSAVARLPCVAFYMGVKSLPRICSRLIEHGMPAQTPAATIQWGTTPRQRTVVATLADLPQRVVEAGIGAPAITVVGRVVRMREAINWFESRPLFGHTVIVTRTRQQASDLSRELEELGARVLETPTIEIAEPERWDEIDAAILRGGEYDWIIFTSANGVRATRERLRVLNRDVRVFGGARIAAVGDATAGAIEAELSLHVDLCPESALAEGLAQALAQGGQVAGKRFLLLRADIARPVLCEMLQQGGGAEVRDVPIYQTRPANALSQDVLDELVANRVQWVTFTSSSTASNFIRLLGPDAAARLRDIGLVSIGPITSETMRKAGLTVTAEAETHTVEGVVAALLGSASKRA